MQPQGIHPDTYIVASSWRYSGNRVQCGNMIVDDVRKDGDVELDMYIIFKLFVGSDQGKLE